MKTVQKVHNTGDSALSTVGSNPWGSKDSHPPPPPPPPNQDVYSSIIASFAPAMPRRKCMDVAIPTYQNPGGLVDTEAEFMNVQFR
jgi:hypothetical protein